jgi:hypothetical protein
MAVLVFLYLRMLREKYQCHILPVELLLKLQLIITFGDDIKIYLKNGV